jgi:hypothetical protein
MTKNDLIDLRDQIHAEYLRRKGLGDYSVEARAILNTMEWILKLTDHLIEQTPKKK